jgi:hypothetical protein
MALHGLLLQSPIRADARQRLFGAERSAFFQLWFKKVL